MCDPEKSSKIYFFKNSSFIIEITGFSSGNGLSENSGDTEEAANAYVAGLIDDAVQQKIMVDAENESSSDSNSCSSSTSKSSRKSSVASTSVDPSLHITEYPHVKFEETVSFKLEPDDYANLTLESNSTADVYYQVNADSQEMNHAQAVITSEEHAVEKVVHILDYKNEVQCWIGDVEKRKVGQDDGVNTNVENENVENKNVEDENVENDDVFQKTVKSQNRDKIDDEMDALDENFRNDNEIEMESFVNEMCIGADEGFRLQQEIVISESEPEGLSEIAEVSETEKSEDLETQIQIFYNAENEEHEEHGHEINSGRSSQATVILSGTIDSKRSNKSKHSEDLQQTYETACLKMLETIGKEGSQKSIHFSGTSSSFSEDSSKLQTVRNERQYSAVDETKNFENQKNHEKQPVLETENPEKQPLKHFQISIPHNTTKTISPTPCPSQYSSKQRKMWKIITSCIIAFWLLVSCTGILLNWDLKVPNWTFIYIIVLFTCVHGIFALKYDKYFRTFELFFTIANVLLLFLFMICIFADILTTKEAVIAIAILVVSYPIEYVVFRYHRKANVDCL